MDEMNRLWKKRCRDNFQMQLRYWNLIGRNSGLMFFIYAMILIGGFYYKKWLDLLPDHFPGTLLVSILLTFVCAHAPIRTFIRRADLVFLLPAESELDDYFRRSRWYSFMIQSVTLLGVWIISMPLYSHESGYGGSSFLLGAVVLLAAKAWAIDCSWQEQFIEDTMPLRFLRTVLTFCLFYFVLSRQPLYVIGACVAIMLLTLFFLFRRQASGGLLHWNSICDSDNRQAMTFLRFANLFTDVPRLRRRTRPRRILSGLFPVQHFEEKEVFKQLFIKTFLRSDEYLGMYVRLTVIGALLGFFLNVGWFSVFIVVSVLYLTGLQLLPIWSHPFPQALAGLYPISKRLKNDPFVQMIARFLVGQAAVLSIAAGAGARSFIDFLLFLCTGFAVSLIFAYVFTKRRIRQPAE
ncbi:ABC transporter permease [Sporolactobacillus shoreicorticis]|uniref:ABC transporter permease n=1 Tax=Sporolactobacillus shoreicorticis TaxID=1923877 RepID=A0ABW5RY48_9BACL|nr:ABC transporter permease [Sporolactobacillus shoreicorticis]MCO7124930.1 ABC transporter permease [Sporolactobacillus shoreicorticis]